jgi:syntaxin-binding protein 5
MRSVRASHSVIESPAHLSVAGPKRPPAPPAVPVPKKPLITWGEPPAEKKPEVVPPTAIAPKRTAVAKVARGTEAAKVRGEREDV